MSRKTRSKRASSRALNVKTEPLEKRILFTEIAGTLLVNVDATTLTAGTPANDVPNTGTLGGVFEATGGTDNTPVVGQPLTAATAGTVGIRMDGTDYLQLLASAGGSLVTAPAGITGNDTVSIETWAWNPGIAGEETQLSWGKRGGPDGTNMSFNYGNDGGWGAVGHWGGPDLAWGPAGGSVPVARQWHHLAYTFDGTTEKVYVDGVMTNSETATLNVYADTPINIGTQMEADGVTPTSTLRGSMTVAKVRIHDGVLTDAQILSNYNAEKASFAEPTTPTPTPPPIVKLVDVDPTGLAAGAANSLTNAGTLGGFFTATGGGDTVPTIGLPTADSTGGTKGLVLDGTDFLQSTDSGGGLVPAPASITGLDPKVTIEAWAWNPSISAEETILSWGKRGGPDGTNMSFNYGSNPDYGAMGHWGSPDLGWGTTPTLKHWHHLVYTFDGVTQRVYDDGVMTNSESLGEGVLNTASGPPINLGTQIEADGVTPTTGLRGSMTLGRVRIYAGALTDTQIAADYNAEKSVYVEPTLPPPPDPTPLSSAPVHRYSFTNAAGDASAAILKDSIGDADGVVQGAGATFTGSRLVLPGGGSATAAYGDLPNGLLSNLSANNGGVGKVTIEGWVKNTGAQAWGRFFDFGNNNTGELSGPGGTGDAASYLMYSGQFGTDTGTHRFELVNAGGNPGNRTVDEVSPTFNTDLSYAITWDESTGDIKIYEQGLLIDTTNTPIPFNGITDVNNWLGRSNFTGDSNFQGEFDEFRIYDHVLTPGEIRGDYTSGPDVVNVISPTPVLSSIAVNDGSAQRSQVTSLSLKFDRPVTLAGGAVTLQQLNTGGSGANNGNPPTDASAVLAAPTTADGGKTWVYSFVGGNPFMQLNGSLATGSLVDGIYTVNVDPTKVTAGDVQMAAPASLTFHRLFGDQNGNKTVNNQDYGLFRNSFLKSTGQTGFDAAFDFDNNGAVNNLDYGQFRSRFLKVFNY